MAPVAVVTVRTAALNLLRLAGFQSIQPCLKMVMHDFTVLQGMVRSQPKPRQD